MATIEELEQQVKAQGEVVKAAKAADRIQTKLKLQLRNFWKLKGPLQPLIRIIHKLSKKEKKKKKKKASNGEAPALTKKAAKDDREREKVKAGC